MQANHAVIEATKAFKFECLDNHPSVIILSAKNEIRLKKVQTYLSENNIQFRSFQEPDIGNQLTALATEPIFSDRRHLFQKYQLVKEPERPVHLTRYVYQYPDGSYYRWFGDCYRYEHKVANINDANFHDSDSYSWRQSGGKVLEISLTGSVKTLKGDVQ